jgi:signal transduction histidine kinase
VYPRLIALPVTQNVGSEGRDESPPRPGSGHHEFARPGARRRRAPSGGPLFATLAEVGTGRRPQPEEWDTAMNCWASSSKGEERRFVRTQRGVVWLRGRRNVVIALAAVSIVAALLLDIVIPGYAIAGFYLFPLILVAFALRDRLITVVVSVFCLSLTVLVMVLQSRAHGQNILFVCFGALAGAGLIALGYLYNRFDQLYESQRATTTRLQLLNAQLQKLQELSTVDSDRPFSELVDHIVRQARQLLASDVGALFRLDAGVDRLSLQAVVGLADGATEDLSVPIRGDPVSRAVLERKPVAVSDLTALSDGRHDRQELLPDDAGMGYGACLAVPLIARQELYGALALYYRDPRLFNEEDVSLARSFGDQAALAIENSRLREQVERSAVAAERSRLARDLHDSVTQSLFAASLKAEALHRASQPESPEVQQDLDDLRRLTRAALAEMRTLLLEMRPAALADAWLGDLLQHLVDATEGRTHTSIRLSVDGRLALPSEVTIALYRVAQEALNNVVRHSRARHAWVMLRCAGDVVELVVGDDGRGFDQSDIGSEKLGLRIMRERADAIGSSLRVDSCNQHGTVVTAGWPQALG